ncbi:MAG: hypothetical protein A2945_03190 [Candidatus Liptonbacteria bacterium RIFCSPLOWO2_01_FULL_52_25]|uniref:Uncharacterized protein n=1 Tax=Candidatus Liptonbacteria bacterium RIFCSPLOWO2_01_FULL_52_25 TaxID=1798650 RepID=A0A1G2CE25_9BACT|nr:MAG: hypothetical protein A2945_03190 [Candidatus Liptonbacteria bacterium RIFCSPLOWO2_01_FULL_52_25]
MIPPVLRYRFSFQLKHNGFIGPRGERVFDKEISDERQAMEEMDDVKDAFGEIGGVLVFEKLEEGFMDGPMFVATRTIYSRPE